MSRIRVKAVVFSREELETYLIKNLHMPKDIVVTGIAKPVDQEVWVITVHSSEFPELSGDLNTLETSRTDTNRLFKKVN